MSSPISCPMCSSNLLSEDRIEAMFSRQEERLVSGKPFDCTGVLDIDPAKLLKKVVTSIMNQGQGHLLYEFPELMAFLGSRIPARSELSEHANVDERMFEAKAKWPNLIPGAPT